MLKIKDHLMSSEKTVRLALLLLLGGADMPAFLALKGCENTVANLRLGDRGGVSFQTFNANPARGQVLSLS